MCRICGEIDSRRSSVQSPDGKATYVQLNLVGNQGTALGDESVAAVRNIVDRSSPPPGVKVYVTGSTPLVSDMQHSGNRSILKITVVTVAIIFTMLLLVYRSVITVILLLVTVGVELAAARGVVAFFGHNDIFVLSTFAVNMLVFLCIAAGTDYGIFFFGRYQEARQAGEDRETAYYTTYRSVAPVVLASGLTIAGAILCLSFARLPYFQTMGIPCAVGMFVAVACRRHAGSGRHCPRQPVRIVRSQAQDAGSSMARHRHRDCPLARAHSGSGAQSRAGRPTHTAGL